MRDRKEPVGTGARLRRRLPVAGAAALAVGIGCAVLYGAGFPGKEASGACAGRAATAARLRALARGEVAAMAVRDTPAAAPDLRFVAADGRATSLADFRGRTVLLNLWATWCVPCRQEMPALDRLEAKLGGAEFAVVAVNVDTAKLDRPKAFLKDNAIAHLAFYADPSAGVLQTMKADGAMLGLPTSLLVDRDGCALGTMAGPADWSSPDAEALIAAAKG